MDLTGFSTVSFPKQDSLLVYYFVKEWDFQADATSQTFVSLHTTVLLLLWRTSMFNIQKADV
jgi:hypothetical protein